MKKSIKRSFLAIYVLLGTMPYFSKSETIFAEQALVHTRVPVERSLLVIFAEELIAPLNKCRILISFSLSSSNQVISFPQFFFSRRNIFNLIRQINMFINIRFMKISCQSTKFNMIFNNYLLIFLRR